MTKLDVNSWAVSNSVNALELERLPPEVVRSAAVVLSETSARLYKSEKDRREALSAVLKALGMMSYDELTEEQIEEIIAGKTSRTAARNPIQMRELLSGKREPQLPCPAREVGGKS